MRSRPWLRNVALIIGLFVVVYGTAAYLGIRKARLDRQEPEHVAPIEPEETRPPAIEILHARAIVEGLEILPVRVSDEASLKGQHHVRLTLERGRVTIAERIGPSDAVRSSRTIRYFDDGGWQTQVQDSRGTVVETLEMDRDGRQTRVDRAGSPLLNGCSRLAWRFDDTGNPIEKTCQDGSGATMLDLDGCEVTRLSYDDARGLVAKACFSRDGRARLDSSAVHRYRHDRDERGRIVQSSFFDEIERETQNTGGCGRLGFAYDIAGNEIARSCLGADGSPSAVRGSTKVADRYEYDPQGCLTKQEAIDASGAVVIGSNTYVTRHGRDAHCSETSVAFVDAAGRLVAVHDSPSRTEKLLGVAGDVVEERCFDANDAPGECSVSFDAVSRKASILRISRDERGREISRRGFDAKGEATDISADCPHEERSTYDDRGLVLETSYFDSNGAPALVFETVARFVNRYDAAGALLGFRGFGLDGKPVNDSTLIHDLGITYDERHQRTAIELRTADGEYPPRNLVIFGGVEWPTSAARMVIEREEGHVVRNTFYDHKGKRVATVDCRSRDTICSR